LFVNFNIKPYDAFRTSPRRRRGSRAFHVAPRHSPGAAGSEAAQWRAATCRKLPRVTVPRVGNFHVSAGDATYHCDTCQVCHVSGRPRLRAPARLCAVHVCMLTWNDPVRPLRHLVFFSFSLSLSLYYFYVNRYKMDRKQIYI
jgi:hypothetical protein